jgi:hypothetical protein
LLCHQPLYQGQLGLQSVPATQGQETVEIVVRKNLLVLYRSSVASNVSAHLLNKGMLPQLDQFVKYFLLFLSIIFSFALKQ